MLTSIIFYLILHSICFIETHSKEFTFDGLKLKNIIATTNTFLINPNIILYCSFPLNICECLACHKLQQVKS